MRKIIHLLIFTLVFIVLVYPSSTVYPAPTPKITVNSFFDILDSGDNLCTLREAIIAANHNLPSGLVKGECPAGTTLPEPTLPTLADDLTIASGETISLTFPVNFDPGLVADTQITNTADVVCNELSEATLDSVTLTIAETSLPVYLPLVVNE